MVDYKVAAELKECLLPVQEHLITHRENKKKIRNLIAKFSFQFGVQTIFELIFLFSIFQ